MRSIKYILKHKIVLVLVITAFVITLLPFIFDGHYGCIKNECGFIIGTNYRDGLWYLSVAATSFKTIPFRMPIFSGWLLQGYHYLPNLLSYLLSFIGIPITFSFYQLFPVIYMVILTILAIHLARKIKDNPAFAAFFLFFTFFGISLTMFTSLYHFGYLRNNMLINTFQSTRILESIHAAFSYLILLLAAIIIYKQKLGLKNYLLLGFLIFLVFGIKFYTAVVILLMLFFNEMVILLTNKKFTSFIIHNLIFGIGAFLGILIFYNPFLKSGSSSIFTFAPFATVHHLIENPYLFYIPNMVLARYFLYAHGWSPRLFAIELFSTFLFIAFYFGSRVIGFFYLGKQIITRKISRFEVVLTLTIIFATAFSILFVQRGDWFNPMQFAVYAAFLMNIFAAKLLYELWEQKKMFLKVLCFVIILITFPSNLVNLGYLINNSARYVIPQKEMEALSFLKKQSDGTVLFPIFGDDLSYVSAFTGKQTYVNFINVLQNADIPYVKREEEIKDIENLNVDSLEVKYIYIPISYKKYDILAGKCQGSKKYKQVFKNDKVIVFEKTS